MKATAQDGTVLDLQQVKDSTWDVFLNGQHIGRLRRRVDDRQRFAGGSRISHASTRDTRWTISLPDEWPNKVGHGHDTRAQALSGLLQVHHNDAGR